MADSGNPDDPLRAAREAVDALTSLSVNNPATQFLDVLECVATHGLFEIPEELRPFAEIGESGTPASHEEAADVDGEIDEEAKPSPSSLQAWRAFLETPYNQVVPFAEYISDTGPYGTHQGVKGLQFARVLVVLDDSEARGFMFSYEKLFGAKLTSDADRKKVAEGTETGVDRTRRLLYVTCTRAQKSLALVAYTASPDAIAAGVVGQGWFRSEEIERV